jgi:hypothetical protein
VPAHHHDAAENQTADVKEPRRKEQLPNPAATKAPRQSQPPIK